MCQNVTTVDRRTIVLCKQRHEGAADVEEEGERERGRGEQQQSDR